LSEKLKLKEKIEELAFKYALLNAVKHDGKAVLQPVINRIIAEEPEFKRYIKEFIGLIREVVSKVNSMNIEEQRRILEDKWPELLVEKKVEEKKALPPLPNVEKYKTVKTRFAPNPDFVLTLGNARAAIISYEYAKMYNGKFILRFEDTDPKLKTPLPEAYDLIREDLKWLGIKWDEEYIQSQRLPIFYKYAEELIKRGGAYVCTCSQSEFKKYRDEGIPCPHRDQDVNVNLELWDKMLNNEFSEGEVVLRVKTDIKYPDVSVRDWVAFRIIDTSKNPHPIVGDKYNVWPTYNFAVAIDDHLMGVTHIMRGKEHAQNTIKQQFVYQYFNWKYPETIHFGRLKFEGLILSKSKIRKLLEEYRGEYIGFDDPRFGTLRALRRRGYLPETIRRVILDVGVKPSDATISVKNIASINRKILDPITPRIMFVREPLELTVKNMPELDKVEIPYHPTNKELGKREVPIRSCNGEVKFYISKDDLMLFRSGKIIRLMELINIKVEDVSESRVVATFHSLSLDDAKKYKSPIIQWVPMDNVRVTVLKPSQNVLEKVKGLAEPSILNFKTDTILQFVRFGFVRVDEILNGEVVAYFAHE